ncbi:hypothetical protein ABZ942_08140 [Nocardia sp. NPDC046473]|uniref:hypothetical protein n=1 Tax=Nocardia sp. NPDC046473 TaxID=3155733 RepID=UPI0033D17637
MTSIAGFANDRLETMTVAFDDTDPPEPVGLSFVGTVEATTDFAGTSQEVLRRELGGVDCS